MMYVGICGAKKGEEKVFEKGEDACDEILTPFSNSNSTIPLQEHKKYLQQLSQDFVDVMKESIDKSAKSANQLRKNPVYVEVRFFFI